MHCIRFEETRPRRDACPNATPEQTKAGPALERACDVIDVCVLPNPDSDESGPTSPEHEGVQGFQNLFANLFPCEL